MEYLYLNGKNSVAITFIGSDRNAEVQDVYINEKKHDFGEEKKPNKKAYAEETKRKQYSKFLNNQFENLTILTGAGSSIGIGKKKKGKILSQLWDDSEKELTKTNFDVLCELVEYKDVDKDGNIIKNLEKLLSLANIAKAYVKRDKIDIAECVEIIKKLIKNKCTLELPENSPQSLLLNKVTKRKVTYLKYLDITRPLLIIS